MEITFTITKFVYILLFHILFVNIFYRIFLPFFVVSQWSSQPIKTQWFCNQTKTFIRINQKKIFEKQKEINYVTIERRRFSQNH